MIKLLYRAKNHKLKIEYIGERDFIGTENDCYDLWNVKLKPYLQEVANLIVAGYETDDIMAITGKAKETIYSYVKNIKQIYANELGIKDYQRKHLRHFTRKRTERELDCWQKSKDRLKVVQELRKREKSLQTLEKSKQCAI